MAAAQPLLIRYRIDAPEGQDDGQSAEQLREVLLDDIPVVLRGGEYTLFDTEAEMLRKQGWSVEAADVR